MQTRAANVHGAVPLRAETEGHKVREYDKTQDDNSAPSHALKGTANNQDTDIRRQAADDRTQREHAYGTDETHRPSKDAA